MQAKLKIDEVLLTVGIGGVFAEFLLTVMPGDVSMGQDVGKSEPADTSELGSLAERKEPSLRHKILVMGRIIPALV